MPDDKSSWSGNLVPMQVVKTVPADYITLRVRKDGKPRSRQACHLGGVLDAVHADSHHLRFFGLEPGIGAYQLSKLAPAEASKEAAVEDQNHGVVFAEQLGQGHFPAIGGG